MIKRMLLMLLAMTLIVGGILGYKLFGRHMMTRALATQKPPAVSVSTAEARESSWKPALNAVGTFAATQGIMVAAQLDGAVTGIAFESGALVREGDLLVQQDISTEQAQLANARAAAELARLTLDRAKQLRTQQTNAASDLDVATATFQQAGANVAAIEAVIAKRTIRAPFAGRVGIRQVNVGQFLRSGASMVPLQASDPIYFNFALPQQNAAQVAPGQAVTVTVDAFPGQVFAGTINAINPAVEEATRTLELQATLKNPDGRLQPGMFGSVAVQLNTVDKVITVPLSAIVYNPYGNAVYLVEEGAQGQGRVVRQQFVQTGPIRGTQIAVLKGVATGATVVTAGQLELRNGSSIAINNTVMPEDSATSVPTHP